MHVRIIVVLVFLFSLTGCKPPLDIEDSLAKVNAAIAAGKTEEARIELQNLLVEFPDDLTARILLGRLYSHTGNFSAAEKELEYAIRLGSQDPSIPLDLCSIYLRLAEYESVVTLNIDESQLNEVQYSRFLVYKGIALNALGRFEESQSTFELASEVGMDFAFSQLGDAYSKALQNSSHEAIVLLDRLIQKQPDFIEALLFRGQLALAAGDFETAERVFNDYVNSRPDSNEAKLLLASTLIRAGKYLEARPLVHDLLKFSQQHGYLNQLLSVIEFQQQNYENAKRFGEIAVKNGFKTDVLSVILGISNYQLELYEQSYHNLKSVAQSLPPNHPALRIFMLTQLRLGYTVGAHSTFKNIELLENTDADLLTSLGVFLSREKETAQAQEVLQELIKLRQSNPEILTNLGLLKIELGDVTGVQDLEQALEKQDLSTNEVVILVQSYLVDEDYNSMRELGSKLIDRGGQLALMGYNALGLAESRLDNIQAALEAYNYSLSIDPLNAAALMYKAQRALQNGNREEAKALLTPLANRRPEYQEGVALLFSIYAANGELIDGIQVLDNLVAKNPSIDELKVTMAMAILKTLPEQLRRVPELLNKVNDDNVKRSNYYLTLSESQLRLGMLTEAEETLIEWNTREVTNESAALALLGLYDTLDENEKYLQTLKRSLLKFPDKVSVRALEVKRLIENENASNAQFELDRLPESFRKTVSGLGLQAHINIIQNKCAQAIEPLLNYYQLISNRLNTNGVIKCLANLGRINELESFMLQRVTDYPADVYTRSLLANLVFYSDPELAMIQYEGVLHYDPTNLIAANNYAWLLFEAGNYKKAENVARSALNINDNVPATLDTLARIVERKGALKEALSLMARAYSLDNSAEIAIHYADLLIKNDKLVEAKRIIESVEPTSESQYDEINRLLHKTTSEI